MSDQSEPDKDDPTVEFDAADDSLLENVIDSDAEWPAEFGEWGGEDLEAAYLKAMSALNASDLELPAVPTIHSSIAVSASSDDLMSDSSDPVVAVRQNSTGVSNRSEISNPQSLSDLFHGVSTTNSPNEQTPNVTPTEPRLTPRQIIEACLFVGGTALTSTRLAGVLRGQSDSEYVDREIDELNRQYAAENRPYEIRLGEGGYRLTLREEHERIRHKVYGLGPKEVRLSQDALEVLAVVAYHQPIRQSRVEELGKHNCGPILRQLVRRELLAVERDPTQPREVSYKTTARFLSLFGINSLDDLPRHEQVSYK